MRAWVRYGSKDKVRKAEGLDVDDTVTIRLVVAR